MSKKFFTSALAVLLVITLVVPTAFFVAPQRAAAAPAAGATTCVGGIIAGAAAALFKPAVPGADLTVSIPSTAGAVAKISECIYKLVIIPLARQLIHQIIKATTASIINWINGGNGTGQPSFVLNLSLHLQAVSDAVVLPFIGQLQRVLNPAFAAGIASSILTNYALGTSVGGFLASSQGTLGRYSPNQAAFVAGNFRQGGIPAWFALTTQDNNNPYMLAAAGKSQAQSLVNQAVTNRRQDLVQSNGFLSWCGTRSSGFSGDPNDSSGAEYESGSSISPTASCYGNGRLGNIKTPGTVIKDYVKDAVNSDLASLINPADIDSAIAAIFGASQPSSIRPTAITTAIQTAAVGNATVIVDVNAIAAAATARLQAYTLAWNTIGSAAGTAQTQLTSLKFTCTAQASAADTGLASVNTVLAQVQTALNAVSGTQALILQVQQDAQDTTAAGTAKLNTDLAALAAAPPTNADVSSAQVNAATTGAATASPTGSLTVSGGTLVDQMNLLNFNATALITDPVACPVT